MGTVGARENPRHWALSRPAISLEAVEEVSTVSARVLFRDVLPYEMPSSLAALHRPAEGVIPLPVTV